MAAANPEIVRTPKLRGHYEVAKVALKHDGMMLHYLLPALRNDYDLVTVAVRQNGKALWEAHPDLRGDKKLLDWAKNTENRKRRDVWRAEKAMKEAELAERRKSVMEDEIAEMLEAEEWTQWPALNWGKKNVLSRGGGGVGGELRARRA